jgi:hypothetical protein
LAEPEKTRFTSERADIIKTKASNLHRRAARMTVGVILTFTLMRGVFQPSQNS